jgi:hypothetical protein
MGLAGQVSRTLRRNRNPFFIDADASFLPLPILGFKADM